MTSAQLGMRMRRRLNTFELEHVLCGLVVMSERGPLRI